MMSSPFARKRAERAAQDALPDTAWLASRRQTINGHLPNIETGLRTLAAMSVLLNGRVSTNVRFEHQMDAENLNPSEELGYIACSIIPSLQGPQRHIPTGRGYSWTPDVAMQLCFSLKDRYRQTETVAGRIMQPSGEVSLFMNARTWGRVPQTDQAAIEQLNDQVETCYGDNGYSRRGTHMQAIFQPGEALTQELAETMLAPLSDHVIDYFTLVQRPDLAEWQKPGNFSDAARPDHAPAYSSEMFAVDVAKLIGAEGGPHLLP